MRRAAYDAGWRTPSTLTCLPLRIHNSRLWLRGNICYFSKWACGIALPLVYIPEAKCNCVPHKAEGLDVYKSSATISGMRAGRPANNAPPPRSWLRMLDTQIDFSRCKSRSQKWVTVLQTDTLAEKGQRGTLTDLSQSNTEMRGLILCHNT